MSKSVSLVIASLVILFAPSDAHAVDGPSAGALTSTKVKLPDGPSSVRGLAGPADVQIASGQIHFSIPIDVPSGGGLTPVLNLEYRGDLGNGALGVGWMLDHSAITRSTRHGVPRFDDSDELELAGLANGRLVQIADGSYRVEATGNAFRVEKSGSRWTVTDKDGTVYYFGLTSNSRQETTNGTDVRTTAWFPELVVHLSGKTIAYEYTHDANQIYLSRVTWGPSAKYHIELTYTKRPDPTTSYRSGLAVVTALRLASLRVISGASTLRTYSCTYDETLPTSRLHAVQMTGFGGGGALPQVTFGYAAQTPEGPTELTGVDGWELNTRGVSLFDVDGDGMEDLLRLEAGNHEFKKNLGGAFGPAEPLSGASGLALEAVQLLDLDGDARPELVQVVDDTWRAYRIDAGARQWTPMGEWAGTVGVPLGGSAVLADLDGDGRSDVIRSGATGLLVNFNSANGMGPTVALPPISTSDINVEPGLASVRFTDINGDGLADVVWITDAWMKEFLGRGDGTFVPWRRVFFPWPTSAIDPKNLLLEDLDRDGLVDVVLLTAGHIAYYQAKPDGGFEPPRTFARPEGADSDVVVTVADADGNGSLDIVWSSPRGMWALDLAGATTAGMLARIDNGLGQTTSFTYQGSSVLATQAALAGQPWGALMPVSIAVPVSSVIDVAGGPPRVVSFGVRDGVWDASERRFAGFLETRRSTAGDNAQSTTVTISDQLAGQGKDRELRGRTSFVRIENALGEVLTDTTTTWKAYAPASLPDAILLRLPTVSSVVTRNYQGVTTPVSTVKLLTVDDEGRTIEEYDTGRIDLSGDESRIKRTYAADDASRWIRDRVCEETVFSGDGQTVVSSTRHYYGEPGPQNIAIEPLCAIGLGLERREQGLLDARWVTLTEADYDSKWNPIRSYADGVQRVFGYDPSAQYLTSEVIAPNDLALAYTLTWDQVRDLPLAMTDPSGIETRVVYDDVDRPASLALGASNPYLYYAYDWSGPLPTTRTFTYAGEPTLAPAFPGIFIANAWRESAVVANGAGEPLFTGARTSTVQWVISGWRLRDGRGRVSDLADAFLWNGANVVDATPPAGGFRETYAYDALDRQVRQTLPTGAQKVSTYAAFESTTVVEGLAPVVTQLDGLGRVRRTQRQLAGATESVAASFDPLGRITSLQLQDQQPNAVAQTFLYDTLGRLIHTNDPDAGPHDFAYDDAGRLVEQANAAGDTISYTYDSAGRLSSRTSGSIGFTYHYDHADDAATFLRTNGRLAWVEEPTGSVQLGYDAAGRTAHFRRTVNGQTADEVTTFSASGKPLFVDYQDGASYALHYDDADRLIAVGDLWTLDDQDAAGRIMAEHFGNGVSTTYARDPLGLPTDIAVSRTAGAMYHAVIGHNAYGAITSVADVDGVGLDHSATFTYDDGARVTGATLGTGASQRSFAYTYDGLQNMLSRSDGGRGTLIGQYNYGESGSGGVARGPRQLTSVATTNGPSVGFDYDAAGRQTQQGAITLTYNGFDQLIRVAGSSAPGTDVQYGYGYDGERVVTVNPNGSTELWFTSNITQTNGVRDHFVRLGDRLVAKLRLNWTGDSGGANTSSGAISITDFDLRILSFAVVGFGLILVFWHGRRRRSRMVRISWLLAGASVVGCSLFGSSRDSVWQLAETTYFHTGIGPGPSLMTRTDSSLLEERRFDPFGDDIDAYRETAIGSGAAGLVDFVVEPHGLTNKPTDATTGWSYHGARWMAPQIARWLTPDPAERAPDASRITRPWSLNPYQYAQQNPTLYWDPNGNDVYFVVRTNNRDIDIEGARTRVDKIEQSPMFDAKRDVVRSLYVPDLGTLKSAIEDQVKLLSPQFGKTRELSVFGHAGAGDGPRGDQLTSGPYAVDKKQMNRDGWRAINFNWGSDAVAVFLGCNTFPWVDSVFSNVQTVRWAAGYSHWSYGSLRTQDVQVWGPGIIPTKDGRLDEHPDIYFVGTDATWAGGRFVSKDVIPMDAVGPHGERALVNPTMEKDYQFYVETDGNGPASVGP